MEIIIDRRVCKKIRKTNQEKSKTEIGGILLGNLFSDYVVVVDMTFPSSKDQAGLHYFIRNKKSAQKQANRYWHTSGGTISYLGEWHTHFENTPSPSKADKTLMIDMLQTSQIETDFLILIIVGFKQTWIGLNRKNKYLEEKMIFDFSRIPYRTI